MSDLLQELAQATFLSEADLLRLIRSAPHRYKVFKIRKRAAGQFRTIAQPAKEVKLLQRWLMKNVLKRFEIHPAATAYRRGISIAHNARRHAKGNFVLKMDFVDFFPSIKPSDLRMFLRHVEHTFDAADIDALCQILFWQPKNDETRLSIGAPSSPLLSNILLVDFDKLVFALSARNGVVYTRYADDLTFSAATSQPLSIVEKGLYNLCRRLKTPSLQLNSAKTARVSKRESRRVTGLIITNDRKVSIGREQKRLIRATVHRCVLGKLAADDVVKLRGLLAHINSVEPLFLRRLEQHYGAERMRQALNAVHSGRRQEGGR